MVPRSTLPLPRVKAFKYVKDVHTEVKAGEKVRATARIESLAPTMNHPRKQHTFTDAWYILEILWQLFIITERERKGHKETRHCDEGFREEWAHQLTLEGDIGQVKMFSGQSGESVSGRGQSMDKA